MTELLKKAFDEAAQLPDDQQDAIASLLLEELKSDRAWGQAFDQSQDALEKLADEAIREHTAGSTDRLDPSSL
jgi:aspartate/glutamate racemase